MNVSVNIAENVINNVLMNYMNIVLHYVNHTHYATSIVTKNVNVNYVNNVIHYKYCGRCDKQCVDELCEHCYMLCKPCTVCNIYCDKKCKCNENFKHNENKELLDLQNRLDEIEKRLNTCELYNMHNKLSQQTIKQNTENMNKPNIFKKIINKIKKLFKSV